MNADVYAACRTRGMSSISGRQAVVPDQTGHPDNNPGSRKITVVFLVHNVATWDALHGIYEAMAASDDFVPTIITIPWNFEHERGNIFDGEEDVHAAFVTMGLPHLRFDFENQRQGLDILKSMRPDLLFRQAPWDRDIPDPYSVEELSFTRLIYTDYGLGILPLMLKDGLPWQPDYDQDLHRKAWMLICSNEEQKKIYESQTLHGGLRAVVTGYPKFDMLVRRGQAASHWPIKGNRRRFRLIWAPHHSVLPRSFGFGTFHRVYKDILRWASNAPNIEFVLRPHPMLLESCAHRLISKTELDAFLREWTSLDNTSLQTGGDYAPLLSASDAMLTDGISFLAEYQLFDKPLIWLDSGCNVGFNAIGERVILGAYRVQRVQQAIELISEFIRLKADPLQPLRRDVVRYLMPFPGASCANVLNAIRENLSS